VESGTAPQTTEEQVKVITYALIYLFAVIYLYDYSTQTKIWNVIIADHLN
jgi:hypothetical protein